MSFLKDLSRPLICSLVLAPVAANAQPANTATLKPLSAARKDIVFREMTPEQKKDLAEGARVFLKDLYVHRHAKQDYYSNVLDPVPAIEALVKSAPTMSTPALEMALYHIFTSQRDLHLNYHFPPPYGTFTSFLPLNFTRTAGDDSFFEVRIAGIREADFKTFAPAQRMPQVGDTVISYNGLPIHEAIKGVLPFCMGANTYGGFSRALDMLNQRSHRRWAVPETDEVTLTLQAHANNGQGEQYTITLPWITKCPPAPRAMPLPSTRLSKRLRMAMDDLQVEANRERGQAADPVSVYPSEPTGEKDLKWGKITNEDGTFAYFRLISFVPETGRYNVLNEIRRLLQNELADTDGLIFDVRDNGGGDVAFADSLSQLFTRQEAQPLSFRLLNTKLNYDIFTCSKGFNPQSPFVKVMEMAKCTNALYTATASYTPMHLANQVGQVYYKPVALLTNARCYSATDMFSCALQDNKGCRVFGEDPRTGAGGANVMTYTDFMSIGPKEVFKPLPFGNHEMRVSWRQNLRFGDHDGEIIEDYGCKADVDVSKTLADLLSGGKEQLSKITQGLMEMQEDFHASAQGETQATEVYLSEGLGSYTIKVKETPYVSIYLDGVLQETVPVEGEVARCGKITCVFPTDMNTDQVHHLTFVGMDENGETLWNLKRIAMKPRKKIAVDAAGLNLDFAAGADSSALTIFNREEGTLQDAWHTTGKALEVGFKPNYVENLHTEAVLNLDLKAKKTCTLEFGASYDTEPNTDYFYVVVSSGNERKVLMSTCGTVNMKRHQFDLSAFAGKDNVIVTFGFVSDAELVMQGVRISDICVK